MIVEVICDTGAKWKTSINATFEQAQAYFVGNVFVDEAEDGKETRHRCTEIRQVG